MYSRARFSRWRQGLGGAPGGAALAGVLAGVLAVLLGLGAAGVFPPSGTGPRAAAADAAGPAGRGPAGPAIPGTGRRHAGPARLGHLRAGTLPGTGQPAGRAGPRGQATSQHAVRSATGPATTGLAGRAEPAGARGPARAQAGRPPPGPRAGMSGTSCRSVAHIGDSTSVGLVSPLDLPDPAQRLAAQYREVGVRRSWIDASGGRSMVEEMPGQVNGYDTARAMVSRGFRGCWVIALGTNDTANVSAGSNVGRMARIQELMSVAHGAPVMWVNVKTLDPSGPWAEANMQLWNDTLLQACRQYPNLRIFDWAAAAQDGWFISDGIHYTPAGYAARAHLIARALARAFPRSGARRRLRHLLTAPSLRPSFKAAVPGLSEPMPGHYVSPVEGDGQIPCNYYV